VHDYSDVDRKILHPAIGACLQDDTRYIDDIDRVL
jgi:hypothetical protein